MARTGVSYSEVTNAANQLVGQGRNPTVEQVRLLLGTGSSTTISHHLRQWKANQEATSQISLKENIPPELVAVIKGLWEKVLNHSQDKMAVIESGYQKTISELQQEVEKYKSNNQRWQKLFNQWQEEKTQLTNDKLTIEQALDFSHKEVASLTTKQNAFLQQLQDRQERIDELHRLHKQAQDNLEHYRESAREQRLLDQQQHEQQRLQLQSDMKALNEAAMLQREKITELKQQYQASTQLCLNLENTISALQADVALEKNKIQELEKSKNEYFHASQHWQTQSQALQMSLDDKITLQLEIQTEIKLLSQQLTDVRQALVDAHDKNKLLSHEKWMLAQEKSQLEGQLKQMQKMVLA